MSKIGAEENEVFNLLPCALITECDIHHRQLCNLNLGGVHYVSSMIKMFSSDSVPTSSS